MIQIKRITKTKQQNIQTQIKAILSAAILALIMVSVNTQAKTDVSGISSLKLDVSSPRLIVETESKIEIKPGESKIDEQTRLEREKADAEAKSKALASRKVVARETRSYVPVNIDLISVYKQAASRYGIADWRVLNAIHYVETGCDITGNKTNSSGATGPMQFLPSTWRAWGVDGDGDGVADIHNVVDAIHSAANYLAVSGGTTDIQKALYSYNHSTSYVNKVMSVAESIAP